MTTEPHDQDDTVVITQPCLQQNTQEETTQEETVIPVTPTGRTVYGKMHANIEIKI